MPTKCCFTQEMDLSIYIYIDRMGDIEATVYGFDRISQSYLVHHYQAGARDVSLILSNTTC